MRKLIVVFLFVATPFVFAQTANFSGIWKLNLDKSDFGAQVAPNSVEYVIRHIGSKISFNYTQDGTTTRVDLIPDNEERVTSSNAETAIWTRCHWSGDTLLIESRERRKYGLQTATGTSSTSKWSLSDDGREFIIERTLKSALYETQQKLVLVKQSLKQAQPEPPS